MIVCRRYIASKQAHGTFEFAIFDSGRYPMYGLPLPTQKISLPYFVCREGRMEAENARKNGFALGEGAIHDNE